jgi:hypothetical protein
MKHIFYSLKQSRMLKSLKKWWKKHIANTCPEHLNDIF